MKKRLILIAPLAILGVAVFIAIGGFLVMLLWNWLMPGLFHCPPLGFWQAVGLLALCRILFGRSGFGRGLRRSGSWRRRPGGGWSRMSEEEREQFRKWMRERWAGTRSTDANPTA
jgi:hypothetical protein